MKKSRKQSSKFERSRANAAGSVVSKAIGLEGEAGEESAHLPTFDGSLMQRCMFGVSLLSQFYNLQVRRDFTAGKFDLPNHLQISLQELDSFALLLVPRWNVSNFKKSIYTLSLGKIIEFLEKPTQLFVMEDSAYKPRSGVEWNSILLQIASSDYWEDVFADDNGLASGPYVERTESKVVTTNKGTQTMGVICDLENTKKNVSMKADPNETVQKDVDSKATVLNLGRVENVPNQFLRCDTNDVGFESSVCYPVRLQERIHVSFCNWCGKRGHLENDCWKRKGMCLICGANHKMVDCPKFDTTRISTFRPKCPLCSRNHYGKDCWKANTRRVPCNWCGKRGHSADVCWFRTGACPICGDSNHHLSLCSKNVQKQPLIFPPWCVDCGSQHLGDDCSSPYME